MAVRFDATGEHYTRLRPDLPVWTACFWFRIEVDRTAGPFAFGNADAAGATVFVTKSGSVYKCFDLGAYGSGFGSFTVTVGDWVRTSVTVNGLNCSWYHGTASGALTVDSVTDIQNPNHATTSCFIGQDSFAAGWINGRVAAFKFWDAELTQAEVENELAQYQPKRTANLLQFHPFLTAETVDYSGAGNTLSGGTGTVSEDGPPIPWGSAAPSLVMAATTGPVAGLGTTTVGVTTTGTASKVTTVNGVCSVGVATAGTGSKSAPAAGATTLGLLAGSDARKTSVSSGTSPTGLASAGTAGKVISAVGGAPAGFVSHGLVGKRIGQTGLCTTAMVTTTHLAVIIIWPPAVTGPFTDPLVTVTGPVI